MAQANQSLSVDIDTRQDAWRDAVRDPVAICEVAAGAAYASVADAPSPALLSILLSDDEEIAELNKVFRDKQGPTNVLSFPAGDAYPDGTVMLGDIAVSFETVRNEAERDGKSIADHLSHMIVHGVLHLLGFDHETDADADIMEQRETEVLGGLGIGNPYAEPDRADGGGAVA